MMKKLLIASLAIILSTSVFAGNNVSNQEATVLITKFYNTYVLQEVGDNHVLDNTNALNWGTNKFMKHWKKECELDYDDKDCYATYLLRSGAQDGSGSSGLISVTPRSNGWYRVNYRDMGWKGVTDVKVINVNGIPKLDDYKPVSSNVK